MFAPRRVEGREEEVGARSMRRLQHGSPPSWMPVETPLFEFEIGTPFR